MTRQSNTPATGYAHYSRAAIFRQLGLKITETKTELEVKPEEPQIPLFDEIVQEPEETTPVVEEPVIEEAQEQPTQEEEVVSEEVNETPEEVNTSLDVLGLRKTHAKALESNGIASVEDLAAYLESGKSLTDLSNISAAAVKSIEEKFEQWQKEQNPTK